MTRNEMLASVLVGCFGAAGQGAWLSHTLDSYPFKILMNPPGEFYSSVGRVLAFVAPLLSLLVLRKFRSMKAPLLTALPVVACPLIFFVLFRIVFVVSGYHYASRGSDIIATSAIEAGFIQSILWLTLLGLSIGLACGCVIRFVFSKSKGSEVMI